MKTRANLVFPAGLLYHRANAVASEVANRAGGRTPDHPIPAYGLQVLKIIPSIMITDRFFTPFRRSIIMIGMGNPIMGLSRSVALISMRMLMMAMRAMMVRPVMHWPVMPVVRPFMLTGFNQDRASQNPNCNPCNQIRITH